MLGNIVTHFWLFDVDCKEIQNTLQQNSKSTALQIDTSSQSFASQL